MEKSGMKISRMVGIYIVSVILLMGITGIISMFYISRWLSSDSYTEPKITESEVENWLAESINADSFDPYSFPQNAGLIIRDSEGKEIYASFTASDEKKLRKFAEDYSGEGESRILKGQDLYLKVRLDGQVAFIHYSMKVKNEMTVALAVIASFMLAVLLPTIVLIRVINGGIGKVEQYTEVLKTGDLSAEDVGTGITELDRISHEINSLKNSLSESLESKWRDEQRTKSEMAQIAHDLKTPLTIIRGNADLLLENTDNEEDRESLQSIIENAEKITRSILEILEKEDS